MLICFLASCSKEGKAQDSNINDTNIEKTMVRVYCYDYDNVTLLSEGSGFFINSNGSFLTNAHVIKDSYYVKIKTFDNQVFDCFKLYKYNYDNSDFAVGLTKFSGSSSLSFEFNVKKGEKVYSFGYPNSSNKLIKNEGKVVNPKVKDDKTNINYIENTAKIDHGSSGGALVNSKGQIIGITTGVLSNNNYGSIPVADIWGDLISDKNINQSPLSYFHRTTYIKMDTNAIKEYFDLDITHEYGEKPSHLFTALIRMKSSYRNKKIILAGSLNISVGATMTYHYKVTSGSLVSYKMVSSTIDFCFSSVNELFNYKYGETTTRLGVSNYYQITSVNAITGIASCSGMFGFID